MRHESLNLSQRKGEDWQLIIVPANREQLKLERLKVDVQEISENYANKAEQYLELNNANQKEGRPIVLNYHPKENHCKVAEGNNPSQLTEKDKLTVAEGNNPSQLTEKDKLTVGQDTLCKQHPDPVSFTGSNNKPKPTISSLGRRIKSTTNLPVAGLLFMMLLFYNMKSSMASKAAEIKIDNQIVMEGEEFCFKYRQNISNGNCYVKFGHEAISSGELQDGRNLTLASGENWCTMCIKNFKLKSIFLHFAAESNDIRTIDEVFGAILKEKLSVYVPKDLEGSLSITSVGRNIKCFIKLPGMHFTNDTFMEEENNITLVTRFIMYMKSGSCSYTIICNITGGITHTVIHEMENCNTTVNTASTPPDTTQLPDNSKMTSYNDQNLTTQPSLPESKSGSSNLVAILPSIGGVVVLAIVCVCIIKRGAIKQLCTFRRRHESVELQQGKDKIELQVLEPETDNGKVSRTLVLVNQPMLPGRPSYLDDDFP
ncbi:Hypothetical predicted protein [Mytilus galloprovincialis]|nr:Hypothetical predicted protein [Mytilus galloprovincialis]